MPERFASWSPDRYDVPYLERIAGNLPAAFLPRVREQYRQRYQEQGQQAANIWIREEHAHLTAGNLRLAASDDEIRQEAKRIARLARLKLSHQTLATDAAAMRAGLTAWARDEHHAVIPEGKHAWTLAGLVARLTDEAFWRRQLRRAIGRAIEGHAIAYGLVHRRAGLYASDDTVSRWQEQQRRNAAMLAATVASNEEGQEFALADLVATSVANPTNRRHELMTRMRGFEEWAKEAGDTAIFVTWTLPSAYHARHAKTGAANGRYDGYTPKEGQSLLSKQWAKARAKIHRRKIGVYGFRVAEPHHDGTPHWHMVLFMLPDVTGTVTAILRQYAYEPEPQELGSEEARAARFNVKAIDPARGSATGYLSKYICKNIDGQTLLARDVSECDEDRAEEGGQGRTVAGTAQRVRAWASAWGIRQFQQVGGPGVTVWRELRRLRSAEDGAAPVQGDLFPFWFNADAGNWAGYVKAMGGTRKPVVEWNVVERWSAPREVILRRRTINKVRRVTARGIRQRRLKPRLDVKRAWPLALYREREEGAVTRYGDDAPAAIKGVSLDGDHHGGDLARFAVTRTHVWTLKFKPAQPAPWTRVNNCTATGPASIQHLPISTSAASWADASTDRATTAQDADGLPLFHRPAIAPEHVTITHPQEHIRHAHTAAVLARIESRRRRGAFGRFPAPPLGDRHQGGAGLPAAAAGPGD